jgi:hypothetical protein
MYVGTTVFGSSFLTFSPKPVGGELAAQLTSAAVEFLMCVQVYKIYNDKEISPEEVFQTLLQAGVLITVAGAVTYVGIKIGQGIANELTNILGPVAWTIQSLTAASTTFALGIIWLALVDKAYCKSYGLAYSKYE